MRTFMFVLSCLLSSAAFANQEAAEICAKEQRKPLECFRFYANMLATVVPMGVDMGLKDGKTDFPGVRASLRNQEKFYELALLQVKGDAAKTKTIQQFHADWKDDINAALPKPGQSESARKADVAKRKAALDARMETLPKDK